MAFYGPMSDLAAPLIAPLNAWLFEYGRMAVYVFLAIGGYLAASKWSTANTFVKRSITEHISHKFWRLAIPYYAAIVLVLCCNELASLWMRHDSISAWPSAWQLASHLLFLQDILHYESLSAGFWYVAIDFQLFIVSALLIFLIEKLAPASWSFKTTRYLALALIVSASLISLVMFSQAHAYDIYFIYYLAAYGIGMIAAYANQLQRPLGYITMLLVSLAYGLALYQEPNLRLSLAWICACILFLSVDLKLRMPASSALLALGQRSYSIFLVHFPISLVVNAFWMQFLPRDPGVHLLGMGCAVILSVALAWPFYELFEKRLMRRFHHS